MANTNTPFGLKPVQQKNGAPYNGAFRAYYVPASYGTALFIGDPVVTTGTANTAAVSAAGAGTFAIGTLPEINKATVGTGNKITGAIVGIAAVTSASLPYKPASTEAIVYVADDPDLLFEIQADGSLTSVDVGLNACLIYTQSGSTSTGRSGAELDTGTTTAPATTAAFQLTIVSIVNRMDNEAASSRVKLNVRINNHSMVNAAAGV